MGELLIGVDDPSNSSLLLRPPNEDVVGVGSILRFDLTLGCWLVPVLRSILGCFEAEMDWIWSSFCRFRVSVLSSLVRYLII